MDEKEMASPEAPLENPLFAEIDQIHSQSINEAGGTGPEIVPVGNADLGKPVPLGRSAPNFAFAQATIEKVFRAIDGRVVENKRQKALAVTGDNKFATELAQSASAGEPTLQLIGENGALFLDEQGMLTGVSPGLVCLGALATMIIGYVTVDSTIEKMAKQNTPPAPAPAPPEI